MIKRFTEYFIIHFITAISTSFLLQCLVYFWVSFPGRLNLLTSGVIWIAVFLFGSYLVISKIGFNYRKVFSFILAKPFGWIFIISLSIIFIKPLHFTLFERLYVGISGSDDYDDGEGNFKNSTTPYFVFHKTDKIIDQEVSKLEEEHEDVGKKEFLFWQTAYAAGYNPKYIKQYISNEKPQKVELFIIAGVLILVECFSKSILPALIYMLIPLIALLLKRPFVFKDFNSLKKRIDQEPIDT